MFVVCVQAALGHEDCAEALVHAGADVKQPDGLGRTAVHLASMCGHSSILVHLAQVTYLYCMSLTACDSI